MPQKPHRQTLRISWFELRPPWHRFQVCHRRNYPHAGGSWHRWAHLPDGPVQARQADVPIYAMIRPRGGNFVYDIPEIDAMVAAIQTMKSAGFAGVVFGALTPQHTLDLNAMQRLCHAARGMDITLHRAVDVSANPVDCVEFANNLGIGRILTSGSAATAPKGV